MFKGDNELPWKDLLTQYGDHPLGLEELAATEEFLSNYSEHPDDLVRMSSCMHWEGKVAYPIHC